MRSAPGRTKPAATAVGRRKRGHCNELRLHDGILSVHDRDSRAGVRVNGRKQVYIPVYRQMGASTLEVVDKLKKELPDIKKTLGFVAATPVRRARARGRPALGSSDGDARADYLELVARGG